MKFLSLLPLAAVASVALADDGICPGFNFAIGNQIMLPPNAFGQSEFRTSQCESNHAHPVLVSPYTKHNDRERLRRLVQAGRWSDHRQEPLQRGYLRLLAASRDLQQVHEQLQPPGVSFYSMLINVNVERWLIE